LEAGDCKVRRSRTDGGEAMGEFWILLEKKNIERSFADHKVWVCE
jgi:hypothetical protein